MKALRLTTLNGVRDFTITHRALQPVCDEQGNPLGFMRWQLMFTTVVAVNVQQARRLARQQFTAFEYANGRKVRQLHNVRTMGRPVTRKGGVRP